MFCYLFPDSFFVYIFFIYFIETQSNSNFFLFYFFLVSNHQILYIHVNLTYIFTSFFFFKQTQPSHMMLQCSSVVDQNQCKISFFFLESLTSSILNASVFFFFLRNFLFNIYLTHFYFIFFFLSQILFLKVELSNDNKG